jgi:hypothetical protein
MDRDGFLSQFISFNRSVVENGGGFRRALTFRPVALVATLLSAATFALFGGVIDLLRALVGIIRRPIEAATAQLSAVIRAAIGPNGVFGVAVSATQADLLSSGIIGFALAAGIGLLTLYVANIGVTLVE